MYEYTRIKRDSGKNKHGQKAILERDQLRALPQSSQKINHIMPENKPHAHHESHLHTMKVVTILIPSFHGRRLEHLGPQPSFCVLNTKKKERETKNEQTPQFHV